MTIAVMVGLWASATDRFYIEDFFIAPGETQQVSILLDNEAEYTAFQSDLYLPEGLTASNFALTARKNSNHSFSATVLPDGGTRMMSYSLKLKTYSGNSGALVTFDVTASDDFAGSATITLHNTLFTTEEGVEIPLSDETCTVSVPSMGSLGDVNGDGRVDVSDVTALISKVLGNEVNPFNANNADMNGDNKLDVSDVTALITMVLNN